jgi:hypothetical protein
MVLPVGFIEAVFPDSSTRARRMQEGTPAAINAHVGRPLFVDIEEYQVARPELTLVHCLACSVLIEGLPRERHAMLPIDPAGKP